MSELLALLSAFTLGGSVGFLLPYMNRNDCTMVNKNIEDISVLYANAKKNIKIATDFDPNFFDNPIVINAFEKALLNGVKISFLTEGPPTGWYTNKPNIEIKEVGELPRHLMIIDEKYIRIERPHPGRRFGTDKKDTALIFKCFPKFGDVCSKEFDELYASR